MDLKNANSLIEKYNRIMKSYKDLQEKYELIINGCKNCKRKDPSEENTGNTPYVLSFRFHSMNTLMLEMPPLLEM